MTAYSRREFGALAGKVAAISLLTQRGLHAETAPGETAMEQVSADASRAVQASLMVDAHDVLAAVPADFMGLSYESGQLAHPDFFTAENAALVALFKTLSPSGVLRLGGNLSEFTVWSGTEPAVAPERAGLVGPDPGHREPTMFTITPKSIQNLQSFLTATGWRCIYGLNLAGGTVEQALAEGTYVAKTLGAQLDYVQFGNEPDLFKHRDQGNKPWTFDEYIAKWKTFRAAFQDKLPNVRVGGPDTAYNQKWVKQFMDSAAKDVVAATSHYYPLGPPADPKMTIDLLMHPGARFDSSCKEAVETSKAAGLPFRMAEGNSCYNAGKPGVSDTFASALWAGDFCLQMAAMGCVGVNLHGGANGYYSPIVGSVTSGFEARPEYYGLMLAERFAGHSMVKTMLDAQGVNITTYAARDGKGSSLVAIFNKDARPAEIAITGAHGWKQAGVERLEAAAIDSKTGVQFGGASVGTDGSYHPAMPTQLRTAGGKLSVSVPAYSAMLIELK